MKKQVYVNETDKVVVTVLQTPGSRPCRGISRCSDEDNFDIEFGKKLSNSRAWLSFNKTMVKSANDSLKYLNEYQLDITKAIEDETKYLEKAIYNVEKIQAELDELIK